MPKKKDLKRVVRSRMQKTGESYTAARSQLVSRKKTTPEPPPPEDYATRSGTKDAVILKNTGRDWNAWVAELDAIGAKDRPHSEIAAHVFSTGVPGWWSQTVAVGYERIRGLREIGQRRNGAWEASKSRTFAVPIEVLYEACAGARKRARWLPDVKLAVRKATENRSMRITWPDDTSVEFWFVAKGDGKSQLSLTHSKLGAREEVDRLKTFWSERLDALAELLKGK